MSVLPEAKLAREAEMSYQMICMATDYDCWHSFEDVNVAMVVKYMEHNSKNARRLVGAVLDQLTKEEHDSLATGRHWEGETTKAVSWLTKPAGRDPDAVKRIEYLFPQFWEGQ
jgi:5'-methylthioadenosine phosphorylase